MYTPENFYQMIWQMIADKKHQVLYAPMQPGEKDLMRFLFYGESGVMHPKNSWNTDANLRLNTQFCIMYDQEPIFDNICDIYKLRMLEQIERHLQPTVTNIGWTCVFSNLMRSLTWPIWCTSEMQGKGLDQVAQAGYIICYYFYHAFVSRDWYRYWHLDPKLRVKNKSQTKHRFMMYCRDKTGSREYRRQVVDQLASLRQHVLYDWDQTINIPASHSAFIDVAHAETSAIHLVLETLFDHDALHLTEKVFKPMVMSQPFIIWGPAGTLKLLKRYGFQTFDHVWSEQYDTVSDPDHRMHLLIELVEKLACMSVQDFDLLYQRCLPIVEHNRKRFFSAEFMETCGSELQENFSNALAERHERNHTRPGGQYFFFLDQHRDYAAIPFVRVAMNNVLLDQSENYRHTILRRYPALGDL